MAGGATAVYTRGAAESQLVLAIGATEQASFTLARNLPLYFGRIECKLSLN